MRVPFQLSMMLCSRDGMFFVMFAVRLHRVRENGAMDDEEKQAFVWFASVFRCSFLVLASRLL